MGIASANEPPVAEAGLPRYAARDPVQLDGSGSYDPDGPGPLSYAWTQISGLPLVITGADTATPQISGFVQTDGIQECVFELAVSDGELTSRADTTMVLIVPSFGESTLGLESASFDPNKPTFIYFGGGDCVSGYSGQPWSGGFNWTSKANVIGFPEGYTPDLTTGEPTYYRYADMIIAYLSAVAPSYGQAIQTAGHSTGGQPAIDVAIRLNTTYKDARYAVNRVTFLDATPVCRANYQECIDRVLACDVDGERCWIDNYVGSLSGASGKTNVLNIWFDRGNDMSLVATERHRLPRNWYRGSPALQDANRLNHGAVAGAYWSVIGPGKNLQLASTPNAKTYHFTWYGDASSGHMELYDETNWPARLPEPVTLLGPEPGATAGAGATVLSCQPSENAVGYQLLAGADPDHMIYLFSDTTLPPTEPVMSLPCEQVYWTVRAYDIHGSTIHADPRPLHAGAVGPQSIRNADTGEVYASIRQAINDAHQGDEIVLGAGVWKYLENLDFKGKSVTLRSSDPDDPNVVAATTIIGTPGGPLISLSVRQEEVATLDGLTLAGGSVAISCRDAAPTIRNCTVTASGPVAIEFWDGYEPAFANCQIVGEVVQVDDPRIIAHWRLDETAGATAHDSAGGNDAIVVGVPLWQPEGGVMGGALQLTGVPNFVATKFVQDPSKGPWSVFAWVKGGAPGQVVVSQQSGANWLMASTPGGTLGTQLKSAGQEGRELTCEAVITDGNWHRIGLSWDGETRILYVDDAEVARDTQPDLAASAGVLYIGGPAKAAASSFWTGLIDDVRIYDRAVTP